MIIAPFLLCLLITSSFGDDLTDPNLKRMANIFNEMTKGKEDGFQMTKTIKALAAKFLKHGLSAGGVFAEALANGPDSNEQKAITALDLRMQKGFNQTSRNIRYARRNISLYSAYEYFDYDVIENMELFNAELSDMKEAYKKTKIDVDRFVSNWCKTPSVGPLYLLLIIRLRLSSCFFHSNSAETDNKMVQWKIAVRQVLAGHMDEEGFQQNFDDCSNDVFEQIYMMSIEDSNHALDRVKREVPSLMHSTTKNSCSAIKSIINDFPADSSPECILEKILQAKQYRHVPIHQFSALVSLVSLNLLNNAIFCSNISHGHDPGSLALYNNTVYEHFDSIQEALITWIPENLNRSWPNFEKEIVNDIITFTPTSKIIQKNFVQLNQAISHNLSYCGIKDFNRQNMVTKNFAGFSFYVNCTTSSSCFEIKNYYKGVRVVVTRYLSSKFRRSLTAMNWAIQHKDAINATLRAHRHIPHLSGLDEFFYIKHNQHFTNRGLYNTIVIIRDTGFTSCSIKDVAIRSFHNGKIRGSHVMDFVYYDLDGCVRFKLIFFI